MSRFLTLVGQLADALASTPPQSVPIYFTHEPDSYPLKPLWKRPVIKIDDVNYFYLDDDADTYQPGQLPSLVESEFTVIHSKLPSYNDSEFTIIQSVDNNDVIKVRPPSTGVVTTAELVAAKQLVLTILATKLAAGDYQRVRVGYYSRVLELVEITDGAPLVPANVDPTTTGLFDVLFTTDTQFAGNIDLKTHQLLKLTNKKFHTAALERVAKWVKIFETDGVKIDHFVENPTGSNTSSSTITNHPTNTTNTADVVSRWLALEQFLTNKELYSVVASGVSTDIQLLVKLLRYGCNLDVKPFAEDPDPNTGEYSDRYNDEADKLWKKIYEHFLRIYPGRLTYHSKRMPQFESMDTHLWAEIINEITDELMHGDKIEYTTNIELLTNYGYQHHDSTYGICVDNDDTEGVDVNAIVDRYPFFATHHIEYYDLTLSNKIKVFGSRPFGFTQVDLLTGIMSSETFDCFTKCQAIQLFYDSTHIVTLIKGIVKYTDVTEYGLLNVKLGSKYEVLQTELYRIAINIIDKEVSKYIGLHPLIDLEIQRKLMILYGPDMHELFRVGKLIVVPTRASLVGCRFSYRKNISPNGIYPMLAYNTDEVHANYDLFFSPIEYDPTAPLSTFTSFVLAKGGFTDAYSCTLRPTV